MDTSEQYIKMCDHPLVQGERKKFEPEPFKIPVNGWNFNVFRDKENEDMGTIWLPRQDQIQGMLGDIGCGNLHNQFNEYIGIMAWQNYNGIYISRKNEEVKYVSFEQLWLAFYMHEKHGLVWGGKEWQSLSEK